MLATVRSQVQGLYEFHLLNPVLVGIYWLGAFVASLLARPGTLEALAAATFLLALCSTFTLYRLTQQLDKRMEGTAATQWTVEVNGVSVGDLADSRVAAIQRGVALDSGLYLKQLGNLSQGVLNAASSLFVLAPMMCFWLAVALVVFEPQTAHDTMAAVTAASPAELRAGVLHLANVIGLVAFVCVGLVVALNTHKGNTLGFQNKFSAAFSERVRHAVECAADGEVTLSERKERGSASHA